MKKFLAVTASAVLAVSMFGFTACVNSGNPGEIKGNYTQPTAEELTSAIDSIDLDKAFGDDKTASGFEILSKISADISSSSASSKSELDFGYKFSLSEDALLGSGTASVKTESASGNSKQSAEYTANIYNDSAWGYAEVTGLTAAPFKGKIDFGSLIDRIPDDDENVIAPTADESVSETQFGAAELIEACNAYKIDLGLDASDGVKIKASITEDTVWALLAAAEIEEEEIALIKEVVTFNTFKLDVYVAFDSAKLFSQASVDMDIDLKIDGDKLSEILKNLPVDGIGSVSGEAVFKLKGYVAVKTFSGEVTLPEGIENDTSYVDMTDMIGDLM